MFVSMFMSMFMFMFMSTPATDTPATGAPARVDQAEEAAA